MSLSSDTTLSLKKPLIEMSFPRFLGLFDTDGGFQILFKKDPRMPIKYRIHPEVILTQKSVELLFGAQECLKKLGIKSKYHNTPTNLRSGRAPVVKIAGIAECRKFLDKMQRWEESTKHKALLGYKRLDWLLLEKMYLIIAQERHNTLQGRNDIKYSLHIPPDTLETLPHKFFSGNTPRTTVAQGNALT